MIIILTKNGYNIFFNYQCQGPKMARIFDGFTPKKHITFLWSLSYSKIVAWTPQKCHSHILK